MAIGALLPIAASVLGPLVGRMFGGDGVKRGGNMTRMAGGRRRKRATKKGGMVMKRYGRGGLKKGKGIADVFRKVLKYGKLAFKVARSKKVRGLVKHGVNTYRDVRKEYRAARDAPAPVEEGEGRRLRRRGRMNWAKRIKINQKRIGRGVADPVTGPLP